MTILHTFSRKWLIEKLWRYRTIFDVSQFDGPVQCIGRRPDYKQIGRDSVALHEIYWPASPKTINRIIEDFGVAFKDATHRKSLPILKETGGFFTFGGALFLFGPHQYQGASVFEWDMISTNFYERPQWLESSDFIVGGSVTDVSILLVERADGTVYARHDQIAGSSNIAEWPDLEVCFISELDRLIALHDEIGVPLNRSKLQKLGMPNFCLC
jgi:hypothetical protein